MDFGVVPLLLLGVPPLRGGTFGLRGEKRFISLAIILKFWCYSFV